MIGRYADLNIYRELLRSENSIKVSIGVSLIPVGMLLSGKGVPLLGHIALVDLFLLLSILINGAPIIAHAVKGIARKQVNVDELVGIAIVACVLNGNFLEGAIVSAIMVIGALVEEAVSDSARNAIRRLMEVTPDVAVIEKNGEEVRVNVTQVAVGDILVIRAGSTIPVDGQIMQGSTAVDESTITGESIPIMKTVGENVYAGTGCIDGFIRVKASKVGRDSTIGKIIQMIRSAEAQKTDSGKIVDRFSAYFTPVMLLTAAGTYIATGDINRAITVLIVGCPCSFILAGPVSTVAAIGRAAKGGILVKGGKYLENIATSTGFYLDKTGTITRGLPRVVSVKAENGFQETEVISMAAAVEKGSLHPLGIAILKKAESMNCEIAEASRVRTHAGHGIGGRVDDREVVVSAGDQPDEKGHTSVTVTIDGETAGHIWLTDSPRKEARQTIGELKQLGINDIVIVSGDREGPVRKTAKAVGIDTFFSGQKPEDKLKRISSYRRGNLVYVGDGINDAPALKAATTGIAMGLRGSDVALETADIVLMNDRLEQLPFLVRLSRRMCGIIKVNILLSIIINLLAVVAGSFGLLTPVWGAVTHNVGSILVVAISASIRLTKG